MSKRLPILDRLEAEAEILRHELNVELPKIIEVARDHGDLKENAEYHAAKERQGFVNARLGTIEERIRELAIYNYSSIPTDAVGYGSQVELEDADTGDRVTYTLLFPEELADAECGVSLSSPVAQALMKKQEGDEVTIRLPSGARTYEIVGLSTIHDRPET